MSDLRELYDQTAVVVRYSAADSWGKPQEETYTPIDVLEDRRSEQITTEEGIVQTSFTRLYTECEVVSKQDLIIPPGGTEPCPILEVRSVRDPEGEYTSYVVFL